MNTEGTGFHTCKECRKNESLWNHTTTDHKEGEQFEDRRSVGASSCNSGDGTDQSVQSLMFMMKMMTVHLAINKVLHYQLMHKRIALIAVLKFTLEQLQHVSVWSPSSGGVLCELAKVTVLKFTLEKLQHVSVLSPSSGGVLYELAKVTVLKPLIKIHISVVNLVV